MSNNEKKDTHKSKIGGQALFEGVMMRGIGKEAMAVRKKDGSIHIEVKEVPANKWYQKTLFVRGVFNFVLQMKNGYNYLMRSMEVSGFLDEEEDDKKKEKKIETTETAETTETVETTIPDESEAVEEAAKDKKALDTFIGIIGMVLGVGLSVLLFMFVPNWVASTLNGLVEADLERFHSLIAGVIRILLFVGYMWVVSFMKEIRMTYEYHGAEHKTIAAYEAGEELNPDDVENVKKYPRFHPRCGTSFIFIVLAISILVYSILPIRPSNIVGYVDSLFGVEVSLGLANVIRTFLQILFLPVLVSISYEIIKLAGRYDRNIIMRIVSAPGLALQRLTTFEPNERQLQVAVSAMLPVIPQNKEEDKW